MTCMYCWNLAHGSVVDVVHGHMRGRGDSGPMPELLHAHTQCYIYSTHTGGEDKSRVHVHAPHTHTHTDDRTKGQHAVHGTTPSTSAVHGCCYPGAQASKTRRIDHPHEPPSNTNRKSETDPCACRGSVVRSFAPPSDWSARGWPVTPACNCLTCDGSVVVRCQVCLHGRCRPRRFPS